MILKDFLDICCNSCAVVDVNVDGQYTVSDNVVGILLDEKMYKDVLQMKVEKFIIQFSKKGMYIVVSSGNDKADT